MRDHNGDERGPSRPEDVCLLAGAAEFTRRLRDAGYLLVLATNQSAVARGRMTLSDLQRVHQRLLDLLRVENGGLDCIYYCPHYPQTVPGCYESLIGDCKCRKPGPGMLLDAAAEWQIDLSRSWMIGDQLTDAQAGRASGCRTILLSREFDPVGRSSTVDYIALDLSHALQIILENDRKLRESHGRQE